MHRLEYSCFMFTLLRICMLLSHTMKVPSFDPEMIPSTFLEQIEYTGPLWASFIPVLLDPLQIKRGPLKVPVTMLFSANPILSTACN